MTEKEVKKGPRQSKRDHVEPQSSDPTRKDHEPSRGTSGQDSADDTPPNRAEREMRRYLSRWVIWITVYAAGFVVIWAMDLWDTLFFPWAIGWVLVWGVWVQSDFIKRQFGTGRGRSDKDDNRR